MSFMDEIISVNKEKMMLAQDNKTEKNGQNSTNSIKNFEQIKKRENRFII